MRVVGVSDFAKRHQHVSAGVQPLDASYGRGEKWFVNVAAVFPDLPDFHRLLVNVVLDGSAIIARVGNLCVERTRAIVSVVIDQQRALWCNSRIMLRVAP